MQKHIPMAIQCRVGYRFARQCLLLVGWGLWMGFVVAGSRPAVACPYSIRDAAFMRAEGVETFRLLLVGTGNGEHLEQLQAWADSAALVWLGDVNVTVDAVSPRSDDVRRAVARLPKSAGTDEAPPAALLVSPQGEVMRVDDGVSQLTEETVMDILARVADSPVRQKMLEHLTRAWCVVLLVPGDDREANDAARQAIREAARRIEGTATEMDKIVTVAPVVIEVPADDAREAVLRWSAGLADRPSVLEEDSPPVSDNERQPRVAMIAGRGQQRGPILAGPQITADRLFEMFEMLGRSCTCTTDAIWTTGRALPIRWSHEMDMEAQIELGFDPNDPEAIDLLRNSVANSSGLGGYQEIAFDAIAASAMTVPDEPHEVNPAGESHIPDARPPRRQADDRTESDGSVGDATQTSNTTAGSSGAPDSGSEARATREKASRTALAGSVADNASKQRGDARTTGDEAAGGRPWPRQLSMLGAMLLGAVSLLAVATLVVMRR